ncbi:MULTISPECIES: hypothetical protein [unclassified Microcoleus]|uniref:hypothetical protein n=1 Tax=unclassified Microcoleus TaxID=2642155 RepID=UPI002FD5FB35
MYTTAAFTMERIIARHKPVGAVRHWRRTPRAFARPLSCLQAKQPADVEDREGITRPIASKSAIAMTPRIPHS